MSDLDAVLDRKGGGSPVSSLHGGDEEDAPHQAAGRDRAKQHSPEPRSHERSRSPRARSRSPRARSRSPRARSRSPRRRSPAPVSDCRVRLEALLAKEGKEVDARVLEDLDAMRPKDAEAVLARLAEANLAKITHPTNFLAGIIKRVRDEGSADLTHSLDMLPRPLRTVFLRLMDEGRLRKGDLESRVATTLRDLPLDLALAAVDRYAAAHLESVRSKTGFMIGIVRRISDEARAASGGRGPPPYGAPPPPPPYGMHPPPPYGAHGPGWGGPPPYGAPYGAPPPPYGPPGGYDRAYAGGYGGGRDDRGYGGGYGRDDRYARDERGGYDRGRR